MLQRRDGPTAQPYIPILSRPEWENGSGRKDGMALIRALLVTSNVCWSVLSWNYPSPRVEVGWKRRWGPEHGRLLGGLLVLARKFPRCIRTGRA
jgi:hypothetical protein